MPLCGLKKSKNRDSSPPYSSDLQELQKFKDRVQRLEKALEDAKEQKDQLDQECSDLRRSLEEAREDKFMAEIPLGVEKETIKKGFQAELSEAHDKIERYTAKIDELQLQIDKLEDKGKHVEDVLEKERALKEKMEKEVKRLQNALVEKENALKEAKQELQNRIPDAASKSPVRDASSELKAKLEAANQELTKERGERLNKEREISRLASEKVQIQLDTDKLKERIKELESVKTSGEDELNKAKDTAQNNLRNQVKTLEETLASYKKKLEDEKLAKENALSRLTVTENMHLPLHSTDASEDTEATRKLAEQFTNLYKNEWAFALQNLQKINKSDEAIKTLQDILVECYKYCQDSAETQLNRIEENMFLPPMVTSPKTPEHSSDSEPLSPVTTKQQQTALSKIPRFNALQKQKSLSSEKKESHASSNGHSKFSFKSKKSLKGSFVRVKGEKCPDIPIEVMKGIKGYRKRVAKQVVSIVQEELNQKLQQVPDLGDQVLSACTEYINKCCEICWNLCIQDPPCHLSWDIPSDRTLNTAIYSVYTQGGSHIDFIVWPALYSGNGGIVLAKGVAQGDES